MPLKRFLAIAMATSSAFAFEAQAGASLFVDDAATTPPGRCQVETWARAYLPGQELTVVPACAIAGAEFSLGVTHTASPSHGPIVSPGVKRLFRDVERHDWGIGASLGGTWNGAHDRLEAWALNVPASIALDHDRLTLLHANLGWIESRNTPGALTFGIGIERVLTDRWTLLAEAYGDHRSDRVFQLGARHAIGDSASLDLLLGHQGGMKHSPWFTLGFNVLLPN